MVSARPLLKTMSRCWLLSNWGNPTSIHNTRRAAIKAAEEHTGRRWRLCREYMEVRKVTIKERV